MQQIQLGNAHQYKVKDKKHQFVVLIKYDNRELGERMRKHTLEPLGLYEPLPPKGVCMME